MYFQKKGDGVRSLDVASQMNYSKPSVSRAIGILRKSGYLTVDENGYLHLTPAGESVASKIYERHTLLTELFIRLGVDPDIAASDACKLEHGISDESFEAIKRHVRRYDGKAAE